MEFHETECIYRLVSCPVMHRPKLQIPFNQVVQHMQESKEIEKEVKLAFNETVKTALTGDLLDSHGNNSFRLWKPLKMEIDGKVFFIGAVLLKISKSQKSQKLHLNPLYFHYVYMLGSPTEAKNFSYTFEYFGNEESKSSLVYTGQVLPTDEAFCGYMIHKHFKGLAISHEHLKSQFLIDNKLNFKVTIRNLKEEAKDENVESGVSDNDD